MVAEQRKFVEGIGHIPTDWGVASTDEVSQKITKGTTPPKADIVDHQEIPFLRVNNLGFNGSIDKKSDFIFVSRSAHEGFLARSRAYPGDILMNIVGPPLGKVALLGDEFSEYNMNQAIVIYRLVDDVLHRDFFLAYLLSDTAQQWLQSRSKKTSGQQNLTIEICKGLPVPIPALDEQKKISQIISIWDKAITTTEQLLANSQQQKKALMQQLLTGKKRLLDKNGVKFSKAWSVATLGEIGEIKSAGVDKKIVEGEKPVRLLNFTDVFRKSFIRSDELNHWVTAPDRKVTGCNVLKGDIFFTPSSETRDEIGFSAVAAEDIQDCCYSYHVVRFRIRKGWDLNFKAFAFTTPSFRKQVAVLADGSGQRYVVSQNGFRSVEVIYPDIEEQEAIGKVLRLAEDEISTLQKKLDALRLEKKALMQQLLTGKRRVKNH